MRNISGVSTREQGTKQWGPVAHHTTNMNFLFKLDPHNPTRTFFFFWKWLDQN
jgi:hypothetical protein